MLAMNKLPLATRAQILALLLLLALSGCASPGARPYHVIDITAGRGP